MRLKGEDPLVFGRGGEEALACEEAGVAFEFVPGVTSALGAASHAGILLTDRAIASSVAFITARDGAGSERREKRLAALAPLADTLVIFMDGGFVCPNPFAANELRFLEGGRIWRSELPARIV